MKQKHAYLFRCYPTPDQAKILARTFGCVRYTYNWALRLRTDAYYQRQERVYYADTSAALTELKRQPDYAWQSAGVLCPHAAISAASGQSLPQLL